MMAKDYDSDFSKHRLIVDEAEYVLLVEELEAYKDRCELLEQEISDIKVLIGKL